MVTNKLPINRLGTVVNRVVEFWFAVPEPLTDNSHRSDGQISPHQKGL